jgi:4-hydroxy-3-methylbut-2-enyl diphosphate reductase
MLIIGGRGSSNTNKLFEISKKIQPSTFFVEQISELPLERINPNTKLGISAGASTPDSLIEEAIKAMSDIIKNENEDFAALLAESEINLPRTGAVVKGTVVEINDREVLVDLNSSCTGFIKADEFDDDEDGIKIGDVIEAVVVKKNDAEGSILLSKKQADGRASKGKIEEAFKNQTVLEGKVVDVIKKDDVAKGVVVSALHAKFFVPASQTGVAKDGNMDALLGTTQKFKLTELGEGKKRTVASIAIVDREARNAEIEEFWSTLCEGKVFEGTVKSMTEYGVFVNIGPIDGMVHKTELSWKRFRKPSDIVSVGDKLTVYIKDLNPDKKRISLGCKTEENNPWNIFVSKYNVEDVVSVKIANIMTYGAFAEIVDGVDGLIHISQIANKRLGNPAEVLHVGDVVDAKITEIDTENRKVSLSIRALLEPEAEEVAEEVAEATEETTEVVAE